MPTACIALGANIPGPAGPPDNRQNWAILVLELPDSHLMTYRELITRKRGEILAIAARRGARNLRLFGSSARNEEDEQSDIDFLVEMESGRSLFDLGGLQAELETLLGRPVDVVTEKSLRQRIRRRVLKEAIPV